MTTQMVDIFLLSFYLLATYQPFASPLQDQISPNYVCHPSANDFQLKKINPPQYQVLAAIQMVCSEGAVIKLKSNHYFVNRHFNQKYLLYKCLVCSFFLVFYDTMHQTNTSQYNSFVIWLQTGLTYSLGLLLM